MPLARSLSALIAATLLLTVFAVAGPRQQQQMPIATPHQGANSSPDAKENETDPALLSIEQRQAKARNDERQKRLVADTDKLLALATQLHADVAKTDKNILSVDVVRRSEEIERLAHSIKERMKG